jgi:DNA-binding CsgD family transcriptional regulator
MGVASSLGAYLLGNMAEPLMRLGRWQEADALAVDALAGHLEGVYAGTLLSVRCEVAALAGRYEEAEQLLGALGATVGDIVDLQFTAPIAWVQAELCRARRDFAGAITTLTRSLSGDVGGWSARYTWPLVWLGSRVIADLETTSRNQRGASGTDPHELVARVEDLLGTLPRDMSAARAYHDLILGERTRVTNSPRTDSQPTDSPTTHGQTTASPATDSPTTHSPSTGAWQTAVRSCRRAGDLHLLSYALLRLAEACCVTGQREKASEALDESIALARSMGAAPLLADGLALARRARLVLPSQLPAMSLPRASGPMTAFGLTSREREVLGLLVEGRSNPQIAATLFISVKTASVHVSNILAKLGVSGRVEAAAVAHRLGLVTATDTAG